MEKEKKRVYYLPHHGLHPVSGPQSVNPKLWRLYPCDSGWPGWRFFPQHCHRSDLRGRAQRRELTALWLLSKNVEKYAVVYTYEDSAKIKRQKWETFAAKKKALLRKAQEENEVNNGAFIPPSSVTVAEFLKDFVELYGSKRWGLSACTGNVRLIENYVNPILGEHNVQDVSRWVVDGVDGFVQKFQKTSPVSTPTRSARTEMMSRVPFNDG